MDASQTSKFRNGSKGSSSYGATFADDELAHADKAHRSDRISTLDAYFAFLKGNLGPGVLALPFAFGQTGWAVGVPVLLVVVAQGVYSMLRLYDCKRAIGRPDVVDFGDVAQITLGNSGRFAAEFFIFVVQIGVCCVFVNFVVGNLCELTGFMQRKALTIAMAPLFATLALLRFVAQLACLNKVGTAAIAAGVVAATVCGILELGKMDNRTFMREALPFRPFSDTLLLASSVFYAFEGLGILLYIEKEMAHPQKFPRVITFASATLSIAFLTVAFVCGVAYRGELQSGSILDFLASRPGVGAGHNLVRLADFLATAAVFFTYPLQVLPAAEILSSWLGRPLLEKPAAALLGSASSSAMMEAAREVESRLLVAPWALQRLCLVMSSILISLCVNNVALLVSLFGAVGQTGIGMLPLLCHLSLMWTGQLDVNVFHIVLDISISAFCLTIMVFGTYFALEDIKAEWG